jgi:RsiW-degrading membrane proteinase PrsW (M82 family)
MLCTPISGNRFDMSEGSENLAPSKLWAYVAVVIGSMLLLTGLAAGIGFLGLPFAASGGSTLGAQLGQTAVMFLGLICGPLALVHGIGSITNRPSRKLELAPGYIFLIVFATVLGLGNVVLNFNVLDAILFPPLYLLGAALPTVGVIAWAFRRLAWPLTWRQTALALVAGSTLSIAVTVILGTILPSLALLLIGPMDLLASSFADLLAPGAAGFAERLFLSPTIIVFLISVAIQAPIPEEFAKALSLPLFGRIRITTDRQAFAIGMASGAGFAILENMLYEGVYAQWSGWSWGGITLLRGLGSVLHPLCTGLVALGWHRSRDGDRSQLLKAYLSAVGLHTLWNGGFEPFVYFTGIEHFAGSGPSLSLYGLAVEIMLVVFLVVLSLGLWWLLHGHIVKLASGITPKVAPTVITRRALAGWAFACALVIIPIGSALGPAWKDILAVVLATR